MIPRQPSRASLARLGCFLIGANNETQSRQQTNQKKGQAGRLAIGPSPQGQTWDV